MMNLYDENQIGTKILDACFVIHRKLGIGLYERIYEEVLFIELKKMGLKVERQKAVPVFWDDLELEQAYRIDLLVEEKVAIEIKAVSELSSAHFKQARNYVRLLDLKLGYLINFNSQLLKDGIKRISNGSNYK